jgi:hypothetical protein
MIKVIVPAESKARGSVTVDFSDLLLTFLSHEVAEGRGDATVKDFAERVAKAKPQTPLG